MSGLPRVTFLVGAAIAVLGFAAVSCDGGSAVEPLSGRVGPAGGVLSYGGGRVVLEFPPGAVTQEIVVTISPADAAPASALLVAGTAFGFSPSGIEFAEPVQLAIKYPPSSLPEGLRESELRLYEVAGSAWEQLPVSNVAPDLAVVRGPIDGFSVIGVLGVPVASITLSPADPTVQVGQTLQLRATPRDATGAELPDRAIEWSSSGDGVIELSGSGSVTGVALGEAMVTARSEAAEDSARVTVVEATGPALELVASDLASPVFLTAPPGDTERLFVVERDGRVRIIRDGALLTTPFLDIRSIVLSGGERGLLSLAFHPDYGQNGEFFVDYTDTSGDTRVVRYSVSGDPDLADAGSAELILTVGQPFSNHNGGQLAFGPDGMLFIGLGDGGSGGDPQGHGQNLGTLLGAILRIDVDGGAPYAVPGDNPFVTDGGARDEIWVYGLRNPWRFSFDRLMGDLYVGDVGQNAWEEIDVQAAASGGGENYGWNIMEGAHCFNAQSCDQTGLELPVLEYSHSDGCSVIGGYVYRGSRVPPLFGHYLYADYCEGWVRSFRYEDGVAVELSDWSGELRPAASIASFGQDAEGELYILTLGGSVYRIVAAQP